jgi:L-lysine exporter family protein LysE/ArgO
VAGPSVTGVTSPLFVGFATGMTLIVAIGAQNAFVLRQGIMREHVLAVVAVCTMSDLALIAAGVAGFGALITAYPDITTVARLAGAAFLIGYAIFAARRAFRPTVLTPSESAPARLTGVLLTCLAITFLNPHVYLDTVVLLGSIANDYEKGRWLFAVGAVGASAVWFSTLGFGARGLRRLFAAPVAWRILDGLIAVIMVGLAVAVLMS